MTQSEAYAYVDVFKGFIIPSFHKDQAQMATQ